MSTLHGKVNNDTLYNEYFTWKGKSVNSINFVISVNQAGITQCAFWFSFYSSCLNLCELSV